MGFQFVPKSVTLNDLELRNGHVVCVISPNSVAFGAYYKYGSRHTHAVGITHSTVNRFSPEM